MKPKTKAKRAARQLYRLCLVDGVLDAGRVRQVGERLAASRRRGALGILSAFERLVRLDQDRHTAVVESASGLTVDPWRSLAMGLAMALVVFFVLVALMRRSTEVTLVRRKA